MAGTAYRRGNDYERRVAEHLRSDGYAVWQTRGSKSPADLLALKPGEVLLVQVKAGHRGLSGAAWNDLHALASQAGAVPVIADRDGRRIRYRRITGPHPPRSRTWPAAPFTTDELDDPRDGLPVRGGIPPRWQ